MKYERPDLEELEFKVEGSFLSANTSPVDKKDETDNGDSDENYWD